MAKKKKRPADDVDALHEGRATFRDAIEVSSGKGVVETECGNSGWRINVILHNAEKGSIDLLFHDTPKKEAALAERLHKNACAMLKDGKTIAQTRKIIERLIVAVSDPVDYE